MKKLFRIIKLMSFLIKTEFKKVSNEFDTEIQKRTLLLKICSASGVSKKDMIKFKRTNKPFYATPRYIHIVLLHLAFEMTQEKASLIYGKNRSIIPYAVRKINNEIETDKLFRKKWRDVFLYAYELNNYIEKIINIKLLI